MAMLMIDPKVGRRTGPLRRWLSSTVLRLRLLFEKQGIASLLRRQRTPLHATQDQQRGVPPIRREAGIRDHGDGNEIMFHRSSGARIQHVGIALPVLFKILTVD